MMSGSLEVVCQCGNRFSCAGEKAGESVDCPHCGQTLDLPDADSIGPSALGPTTLDSVGQKASDELSLLPVESPRPEELAFLRSPPVSPPSGQEPVALHQIGRGAAGPTSSEAKADQDADSDASRGLRASNPGQLKVDWGRWAWHYPVWPTVWGGCLVVAAGLSIWSLWWLPLAALALWLNVSYWRSVRAHFLHGCVLPGVVVGVEPLLIAYATDMSLGTGDYPAVKIVRSRLRAIEGAKPTVGTRLVGVAWYGTSDYRLPHWEDVDPRPVETATSNADERDRLSRAVDREDYAQLEQWLQQCPMEPGVYFVQPDGSVKKYDIYDVVRTRNRRR